MNEPRATDSDLDSRLADIVRQQDKARFLSALFAPGDARAHLMALYAFNSEIARVREIVSQPMLGEIRLQWWREAIAEIAAGGPVRAHDVARGLALAMRQCALDEAALVALVDTRTRDLYDEAPETLTDLLDYAGATGGDLAILAARVLGMTEGDAAARKAVHDVGTAWALTGLLRAIGHHADGGRLNLPLDLLAAEGASADDVLARRNPAAVRRVVGRIADDAARRLAAARSARAIPAPIRPAVLIAPLIDRYLVRLTARDHDPYATPRLAPMTAPALIGFAAFSGRF